ncbi:elongation factor G [Faecalicoccus acidiformans]|uniref:Elongation factor G n=1 Tax=Faecalicoccus acidiformans TaxID=915173 RepID=A0A7W8D1H5_9FIRM|nr:elongation factor G [Faecalicoccus acidiformans]MBB5185466.1 elongation factor G [Faecalicoccus acidiformans]MBM6830600.1 elongation factor G [Faecalicoccus acidiformans]MDM8202988.1 elongation factor G [Faecalicoccus acidiformans]
MRDYLSSEVRNVSVIGHSGAGKTSVLEAMLYYTKATDRFGKTSDGSSMIDFDSEEIKRGISVYTSIVPIEWEECKINFIDTPGYLDFVGEKQAGFAVGDSCLIVVNAKDVLESGTKIAFKQAIEAKKPTIFFINKLDEENTNFADAYGQLHEEFGKSIIPFEVPIVENGEVVGSVNIIKNKAWYYKGPKANSEMAQPVPEDMVDEVSMYKDQIAEAVAMGDDELMEKFFSGEEFTDAELTKGVRIGVRNGEICPVFSGSAIQSIGIQRLMDLIISYFPTYSEKGMYTATTPNGVKVELLTSETETLTAQVFKTIVDPFVGRISYLKVLSGVLSSDSVLVNANNGKPEKISSIYTIKGKHQTAAGKLFTGDIGALVKLQNTKTNDTLCEKGKLLIADPIQFDEPMFGQAIFPKSKNDEDKLSNGLARLVEEDPTFKVVNNAETKETVIYGIGDQHLDVMLNKLKNKYKAEVILQDPKVTYRETITKKAMGEGRHKKQSGGHGQFGHVFVEFEPNPGVEEMEFDERVFGGAVPKQYFPAVENGLRECCNEGTLAGYKMVNIKTTLTDGKYHDVDSSEMAFKLAARLAFKDAMTKCHPILLEPIMNIVVTVPDEYTGAVIGDLNKRRGAIMGMTPEDGDQIIEAQVPMAEMARYSIELRSMTQGLGRYTMEMDRYDPVPEPQASRIVQAHQKEQ